MPAMTTIRETHDCGGTHRQGVRGGSRRADPDHRPGRIATGGFLGLQQGRSPGVPLLRAHQALHREAVPPCSAIPPTPTGGAGSSRSSTTPRPVSTTCNTPPATPRATPNSGSRAITRAARRTCTRRSRASASCSSSRRSPGTCSLTSSSTRTAPSPSRHRNPGRAIASCSEGRDGGHHRGLRLPPGSEPHLRRPAHRHPG